MYRLPTSGTGLIQVPIPSGASDFCLRNFQTSAWAHLSSYSTSGWETSPQGKRGMGVRLTTELHLTSTRICGVMPPVLYTIPWRVQGQLYLCLSSQYPTKPAINIHSNRQSYGVRLFLTKNTRVNGRIPRNCAVCRQIESTCISNNAADVCHSSITGHPPSYGIKLIVLRTVAVNPILVPSEATIL